jgi:hypothetical protein
MNDDRRRLLWLGALPSLVALVVAAGLWLLVHGNAGARDHYDAGRYADARATFAGARDLGVVSPWISPFDAGTAAYGEKDFKAAVRYFKQALPIVPDDRGCDVRINLALTHEAIADEAGASGEKAARQVALRDARTVIGGTGCSDAIEKRIEEKIKQSSQSPNDVKSEQQKQDEVEKRNREAKKAKDVELEPKNEPDQQIQW